MWRPDDAVVIQMLVVGGTVINGLFTAYGQWKRRQWETEDRLVRAQAAEERKVIEEKIDVAATALTENSAITTATAKQVAASTGLSPADMSTLVNAEFDALRDRALARARERDAGAQAETARGAGG